MVTLSRMSRACQSASPETGTASTQTGGPGDERLGEDDELCSLGGGSAGEVMDEIQRRLAVEQHGTVQPG
jgi:hypothetical protein